MVGGYEYHDEFQPENCSITINTTAVTAFSGSYVSDIYYQLNLHNQTVIDGMGREVTMGGYLTGGGHSPLSHIYGLGADQIYEVEMVTPAGEIVIANECQNTDLFWAVRGVSTEHLSTFGSDINISGWRRHIWSPDESHCSDDPIYPNCSIRVHPPDRAKLHGLLGNFGIFSSSISRPFCCERFCVYISLSQHYPHRAWRSCGIVSRNLCITRTCFGKRVGGPMGTLLGLCQ